MQNQNQQKDKLQKISLNYFEYLKDFHFKKSSHGGPFQVLRSISLIRGKMQKSDERNTGILIIHSNKVKCTTL